MPAPDSSPTPWSSQAISYPPELPITQRKDEIVATIKAHQVVVLAGETGSGKTTQLPKMCLEAGLGCGGRIACTQPRRVAALSVARRVAEELGARFGDEVGAKIRFSDQTSKRTRIKFMTDGMLLSEIQSDPLMRDYEAVIVDEAHERSLNIDFLLGHLNQLRAQRPDLKIIITSATIDTEKFAQAFGGAPIVEVSGRLYPVEVIYAPLDELLEESGEFTYIEGIIESAQRIQNELGHGDILAFLPTEKDIREAMELAEKRFGRRMEIVPCFGRLSSADQQRIFLPSPRRKLVLATNIAETSLTIPGIRFVIDTGLARISRYNARARTQRLPIVKIAQSSANQRKGRCGRVADGICIRLYSESDFASRPLYATPEIQRANLADVILRMLASRLGQVETFPFIDPPAPAAIAAGYGLLKELGALANPGKGSERLRLTPVGRKLAKLPVDPTVGRMLLEAEKRSVVDQLLVIASALSIQDPRERPMDKESAARQAHARFLHPQSDFLSLLNIWETLHDELETLSQSRLRKFCKQHFLSYLRMREWRDVYEQLRRAIKDFERGGRSRRGEDPSHPGKAAPSPAATTAAGAGEAVPGASIPRDNALYHAIHCCLLAGLLANPGRREDTNLYLCPGNLKALVFPGSGLFLRQAKPRRPAAKSTQPRPRIKGPEWILAAEIVETNRLYARTVAAIDPRWILEVGEHVVKRSYSDPVFLSEEGRVAARESLRIHGLEIQNHKISYLKVDPIKATEIFIREALLNEDFKAPSHWEFLPRNRRLMRRIQNAHTVVSVAHWMGIEEAAFQFYKARLPPIASVHDLNRFLKPGRLGASTDTPELTLVMTELDLTASEDLSVDLALFPESVTLDNSALPLEYDYKPGSETDGVTLKLPYQKTTALSESMLDWLVPGHLEPKIHHLLKGLPKRVRERLVPLGESAKRIARSLRPTDETLIKSLARHLEQEYSIETYESDWDEGAIPAHLRARIEVRDRSGKVLAQGRRLKELKAALTQQEANASRESRESDRELWLRARERYEREIDSVEALRSAMAALPAQDQPNRLRIGDRRGVPLYAYLGLRGCSAPEAGASPRPPSLALFASPEEAASALPRGVSELIEHSCRRDLAWAQSDLKAVERIGPVAVPFRPMAALKEDVYQHLRHAARAHETQSLDCAAIEQTVHDAKERIKGLLYKVVDHTQRILEKRQTLLMRPEIVESFGSELERLLPGDFLRQTPHWALPRYVCYLAGIERRWAKRNKDPERYARQELELNRFRALLQDRIERATASQTHPNSPIIHLRFAVEEFALSLFAQELGTAFPISSKKLEQAFEAYDSKQPIRTSGPSRPSAKPQRDPSATPQATQAAPDRPTKADLESLKKLFG